MYHDESLVKPTLLFFIVLALPSSPRSWTCARRPTASYSSASSSTSQSTRQRGSRNSSLCSESWITTRDIRCDWTGLRSLFSILWIASTGGVLRHIIRIYICTTLRTYYLEEWMSRSRFLHHISFAFPRASWRLDVLRLGHPPPAEERRRQLQRHSQEQVRGEDQPRQAVNEGPQRTRKARIYSIITYF